MATFVIVPAGFSGGWMWKGVRVALQTAGHQVHALTLTGMGERRHLATPAVGLETHVQDVVNVLEYEDLRDVVLVGHSYGGMVVTALAAHAADRLARLVYLDALLPIDGECVFDLLPGWRAAWEERARLLGDGWQVPHWDLPDWRYVPQPLKSMQQPWPHGDWGRQRAWGLYPLYGEAPRTIPRPVGWPGLVGWSGEGAGWPMLELAADHNPPDSAPQALVALLLAIISGVSASAAA